MPSRETLFFSLRTGVASVATQEHDAAGDQGQSHRVCGGMACQDQGVLQDFS